MGCMLDDIIEYTGKFDENKIKVINGNINVIGNELQIIHDGVIIAQYTLKKGSN